MPSQFGTQTQIEDRTQRRNPMTGSPRMPSHGDTPTQLGERVDTYVPSPNQGQRHIQSADRVEDDHDHRRRRENRELRIVNTSNVSILKPP